MNAVDMSPRAISLRLRRTSQLRALCLKLGKVKTTAGAPSAVREQIGSNAHAVAPQPNTSHRAIGCKP